MRTQFCAVVALLLALTGAGRTALAQGCAKSDFEAVVNAAGAALRDLKQQNLPQFQAAGYGKTSEELVARISGGSGQPESDSAAPNCTLLTGLQADLKLLVEAQQAKWTHMLAKVDGELAK
jgi:hypothetical protein